MSISKMSNAQINELLTTSSKEEIMKDLGIMSMWDAISEYALCNPRPCDEYGVEIGVDQVLTDPLTNVNEISEWVEDNALGLGDRIGDAELCNWHGAMDIDYEEDFYERELRAMEEPIYLREGKVFITKEQKETNLSFYLNKIEEAKTLKELAEVYATVHFALDQSRSDVAPTFFPKGGMSEFECAHRERRAQLALTPHVMLIIHELEDLGKECKRAWQLKRLKQEIYNADIPYPEKKRLWDMCDHDIAVLTAESA